MLFIWTGREAEKLPPTILKHLVYEAVHKKKVSSRKTFTNYKCQSPSEEWCQMQEAKTFFNFSLKLHQAEVILMNS